MKTCKTCKWWKDDENDDTWLKTRFINPIDPDSYEPMKMPWDVRKCCCPNIRFAERPVERNEAAVVDGSQYFAALCTGPDFGCVLHEKEP